MSKFLIAFLAIAFLTIAATAKSIEKEDSDKSVGDEICEMCVSLITKAAVQIIEHEDDFKKDGGKICDVVTLGNDDLDAKCHEIITNKVDQIISLVKGGETTPKDVCVAISACSA